MTISRRTFVKGAIATSAVATTAGAGCGNPVSAAPIVAIDIDADPNSQHYGQIIVPVPRYPDLAKIGGAITLLPNELPPRDYPFAIPPVGVLLVNRGPAGDPNAFIATRSDCPHQGCPLGYSASQQQIECPCHGSRFVAIADAGDPKSCVGLVMHLPAQDNLTVYGTTASGDYVFVDLSTDLSCGESAFPPVMNGKITVSLANYPALIDVGGSVVSKADGLNDKLIVARVATDKLVVLSAICTHKACMIKLDLDHMRMHCFCHGSEYGFDGSVLNGPSTKPVKAYPTTLSADQGTAVISTK